MKGTNLGELEELILLIIGALNNDAYSISIKEELKNRTGRNPSIGAMHSALVRLENKGFINSSEGGGYQGKGRAPKKILPDH